MKSITFENGFVMPMIGLGIYNISDNDMNRVIESAYEIGYHHFDTAEMYENEAALGRAWKNLSIPREDIQLTTKIHNIYQGYEQTLKAFSESCKDLQTDYVDQLLIHWPGQNDKRTVETWKAFEKLYEEGYVKAIGVSNFTIRHLQVIENNCQIMPMSNQVERNPMQTEMDILPYMKEKNIVAIAWSPLRRGRLGEVGFLQQMAEKYNKTVSQIVLRWNIESDVAIIPKSTNPLRLKENFEIFDFSLTEEEVKLIDSLHTGERISFDPDTYDF